LRIISGIARGRKLAAPPQHENSIRPTSDRAREALFNILGPRVKHAKVLDLFAGTGALGLESFSRNASLVIFVDNSQLSLNLIKKNIDLCLKGYNGDNEFRIIRHDLTKSLPSYKLSYGLDSGFDLIFADPPYSKNISCSTLNSLNNSSLLAHNGLLIVEERFDVVLPQNLSKISLVDKRVYGETAFWFYKHSCEPNHE